MGLFFVCRRSCFIELTLGLAFRWLLSSIFFSQLLASKKLLGLVRVACADVTNQEIERAANTTRNLQKRARNDPAIFAQQARPTNTR